MPPLRNTPTGTSLRRRSRTALAEQRQALVRVLLAAIDRASARRSASSTVRRVGSPAVPDQDRRRRQACGRPRGSSRARGCTGTGGTGPAARGRRTRGCAGRSSRRLQLGAVGQPPVARVASTAASCPRRSRARTSRFAPASQIAIANMPRRCSTKPVAILLVQVRDGLGVAVGREAGGRGASRAPSQLDVVVDLAVLGDLDAAVLVPDSGWRPPARSMIDKPAGADRRVPVGDESVLVRPTVAQATQASDPRAADRDSRSPSVVAIPAIPHISTRRPDCVGPMLRPAPCRMRQGAACSRHGGKGLRLKWSGLLRGSVDQRRNDIGPPVDAVALPQCSGAPAAVRYQSPARLTARVLQGVPLRRHRRETTQPPKPVSSKL